MLTGKDSALFACSRFRQPALEFLQRDVVTLTLLFLLPGLLAPGREFLVGDAAGLDPGEALLVLLAVGLEHRVFRLLYGAKEKPPDCGNSSAARHVSENADAICNQSNREGSETQEFFSEQ